MNGTKPKKHCEPIVSKRNLFKVLSVLVMLAIWSRSIASSTCANGQPSTPSIVNDTACVRIQLSNVGSSKSTQSNHPLTKRRIDHSIGLAIASVLMIHMLTSTSEAHTRNIRIAVVYLISTRRAGSVGKPITPRRIADTRSEMRADKEDTRVGLGLVLVLVLALLVVETVRHAQAAESKVIRPSSVGRFIQSWRQSDHDQIASMFMVMIRASSQ
jgi:hypothetical protein